MGDRDRNSALSSPHIRVRVLLLLLIMSAVACSGADESTESLASESRELVELDEGAANSQAEGNADTVVATSSNADTSDPEDEDGVPPEELPFDAENNDDLTSSDGSSADSDDRDRDVQDSAATTTTSVASADVEPDTPLDRVVNDLIVFVEAERGHTFTSRPDIELLDGAAFSAAWVDLISEDAAENPADYRNFTNIYTAMGVIDGDRNLEEIWTRFGDAGVIGYYDTDTGNIRLRSGEITAFTRTVLVHELVHALDDQIFGLDRPEYDDRTDEIDWVFSALTEGSARSIETRYRATFSAAELAEENAARQALPRTVSLSEFNPSFLELQFGRYRYGEVFVEALWSRGPGTVDDTFENPPSTSELVLDPAAYLAGASSDPAVPNPPADGNVFASGVWGEAGWAAVFTDVFAREEGARIADGWGGDRFVAWTNAGQTCVRSHIRGDNPDELDEYAEALEMWASGHAGRSIFYPTADLIRVTACA